MPFSRYDNTVPKPLNIKYPANPQTIGEHLRKRRYDLSLTQVQVAQIIGVSQDSITYWENERSFPQVQYFKKIIEFLSYNPFEFEIKTWGNQLKYYRYRNGLTQKALGQLTGIDPSSILNWECDHHAPNCRKKSRVEDILNINVMPPD